MDDVKLLVCLLASCLAVAVRSGGRRTTLRSCSAATRRNAVRGVT
jgi:hypothetical protein